MDEANAERQPTRVSVYSANKHLIDFGPAVAFEDIKDGLATTLLIGEIRDELPPWGKPGNSRDPALGINKSPKGFGGTFYNGCLFAMADGSVRHISETVDTKVIEALGTPAGGRRLAMMNFRQITSRLMGYHWQSISLRNA
jgi:hypothetical protein